MNIPTPNEYAKDHGHNPFPPRWERWLSDIRQAILISRPTAGRNVTCDERHGKGTVINVERTRPGGGGGPVTGACCIGETCSIATQADCEADGGTWVGPGTTCDPNPCLNACDCAFPVSITTSVVAAACPSACNGWTGTISHPGATHAFAAADFDGSCDATFDIPRLFCESGCTDDPEGFHCPTGESNNAQVYGALEAQFDCTERTLTVFVEWDAGCACCTDPCGEENCPASFCGGSNGASLRTDHTFSMDDHGTHSFDDHVTSSNFSGACTADIHSEITF